MQQLLTKRKRRGYKPRRASQLSNAIDAFRSSAHPISLSAIERVGITRHYPAELIFSEEDKEYSATLKAVRKAYALLRSRTDGLADGQERLGAEAAYYLV